jgi:copper chaperone CopZ
MARETFQSCIEGCLTCAQSCEHCGDACIAHSDMANCVRTCRDCAQLCWTCSGFMSRGSPLVVAVCRACAEACAACAAECAKHTADHCRRCADDCRRCAEECWKMAGQMSVSEVRGGNGRKSMQKPKLNQIKVESSVPAGKVKSLKLSGIHNCCQLCCEAIKEAIANVDGVTGDTATPRQTNFEVSGDFSAATLIESLHAAGFHAEVEE